VSGRLLCLIVALVAARTTPYGHHSIAGVYDASQRVTIEGVVTRFHFVNPHPFVVVDVTGDGGASTQWRLELDNRSELTDVGMTAETLKPGDRIVVTGSRARSGSQELYVRRLDRPADGFQYEQVGASPRIRTSPAGL
jgi:hypothetical protein